jgi:hypothetical protein
MLDCRRSWSKEMSLGDIRNDYMEHFLPHRSEAVLCVAFVPNSQGLGCGCDRKYLRMRVGKGMGACIPRYMTLSKHPEAGTSNETMATRH